jgi:hypothetical protein
MKMNCEHYEQLLTGRINNELSPAEQDELNRHLEECASCRAELAAIQQIWGDMGAIETPEPSAHMQVKFQAMLDTYKDSVATRESLWHTLRNRLNFFWQWQPRMPFAYQLLIIVISFGCGYWVFNMGKGGEQSRELTALSGQVHELKQTMMLAMLENPSASERIRGVSYTSQIKHVSPEVIAALFATLNGDPNVNVRLSTLDELSKLANYPEVRAGLIKSITQQDSPLMQSAIADVMLKLQEKKSVKSFEELLKQKNLDPGVKDKIKETINSLI